MVKEFDWIIPAHHVDRTNDWFWAIGLITIVGSISAFLLGNGLFGVFILIAGGLLFYTSTRRGNDIVVHVEEKGLVVDGLHYPAKKMKGFAVTKDSNDNDILIVHTDRFFMPMVIVEIPDDIPLDELSETLETNMAQTDLHEPQINAITNKLGLY